jgi:hypothetical protein
MTIVQHPIEITTDCYDLLNLAKYFMIPTGVNTNGIKLYTAYILSSDWLIDFMGELPLEELICEWAITGIGMDVDDQERVRTYLDNSLDFGTFNPEFDKSLFGSTLGKHLLFAKVGSNENNILKPSQPKEHKQGFIYVIQLDGCIKVGFSTDVDTRIKQFETTSMRVDLLHKVPALLSQEKEFHRLFNNKSEKYTQSPKSIIQVINAYLTRYDDLVAYLKNNGSNGKTTAFNLALTFVNLN